MMNLDKRKLLVIGHARHGKDSISSILRDEFGLSFMSSSHFVMEKAVIPYLAKMGIVYSSPDDCYADRINHRADWFDAIAAYNRPDPGRLGKELFSQYDIYCGLRRIEELARLKLDRAYNFSFWVDAFPRIDPEDASSCTVRRQDADQVIYNGYVGNDWFYKLKQQVIDQYKIWHKRTAKL